MATTRIRIQKWANVPGAEHVVLCRKIQEASLEAGMLPAHVQYVVTDLNTTYTYRPAGGSPIRSGLALDLKPTVVYWAAIDEPMILVLAHMLILSYSHPGCRFCVDSEPEHEPYLKKAYAVARCAVPDLPLPRWLGGSVIESLEVIDRPDWLDFRS